MSRRNGFVPSQKSRDQAHNSNPWKRGVRIPEGEFSSLGRAAQATGISEALIIWRCHRGEEQRNNPDKKGYKDFRDWYLLEGPVRPKIRPVRTPAGDFESVASAARHHEVTSAAIIRRIREIEGWDYL